MKILVAIDGSEHADQAARAVQSRPWPAGSTIRVLSAVPPTLPPPPAPAWTGVAVSYHEIQQRQRVAAETLVARAADSLRRTELTVETSVRLGDPRHVIVDEAGEWSADLIIMGSRGLTGLKRWVLGSVAQYVVGHAPCSVEVVRQKDQSP
jgi:nucleotide-binding universal stress UspA family protein